MVEIMQLYKQLLMKKGFYNEPKTRKPILSPYNPDSQMVILETELYKPLINREIKHSVQQSVNLIRVGMVVEIDTFQSNTAKSLI